MILHQILMKFCFEIVINRFGIFTWSDGRRYEGFWKDGKQDGQGKYYLKNGTSKFAEWEDGKRVRWIEEEN